MGNPEDYGEGVQPWPGLAPLLLKGFAAFERSTNGRACVSNNSKLK